MNRKNRRTKMDIYFSGKLNLWFKRLGYRQIFVAYNPRNKYGVIKGIYKHRVFVSSIEYFKKTIDGHRLYSVFGFNFLVTKENLTNSFLELFGGVYVKNIKTGTLERVPADLIELEIATT